MGGEGTIFSSWSEMKIPPRANAVTTNDTLRRVLAGRTGGGVRYDLISEPIEAHLPRTAITISVRPVPL